MFGKTLFIFLILFYFAAKNSFADDIITDRPEQTESAFTVPAGDFQVETGFLLENDKKGIWEFNNFTVNSTLLRIGVIENFELRAALEYMNNKTSNKTLNRTTGVKGLGPFTVGLKMVLLKESGLLPQTAFLGHFTLPSTGADAFSPTDLASEIRFSFSHVLSDDFSLGYNLGGEWDGNNPAMIVNYTLTLSYNINGQFGCYGEFFGSMTNPDKPRHSFNGGFTYLLRTNLQMDAFAGTGLSETAVDFFWGIGLSLRLPD